MSRTRTADGARIRPAAPPALPPALGLAQDFARRALGFADALFRAWGARRLAREMAVLPDYRLKDIGLSRAEIGAAIAGFRRPYRWEPDCDLAKMDPSRFGH